MTDFTIPALKSSHGNDNRGFVAGANPGVAYGRYGAMFDAPSAQKLPQEALMALATAMIKPDIGAPITDLEPIDENPSIPAGYTYFGQFIDHDITFDPTPFNTSAVDVGALVDFRSPALDLDNMYGRGPDDQPYMYEKDGFSLRVGRVPGHADAVTGTKADLPRLPDGTPILGDKRNDENKIVSQFHGAMIQFHNKVAADTAMLTSFGFDPAVKGSRFRTAANIVRWHYQYVVVFDYLRHICLPGILTEVLNFGEMPRLPNYLKTEAKFAYMPIEFAGAAFRFGHSMIRPSYSLNSVVTTAKGVPPEPKTRIPTFTRDETDLTHNLNGFPGPLADVWGLDFGFFLDLPAGPGAAAGGMKVPQPSYRIDALLTGPLQDLPEFFKDTDTPAKLSTMVGNLAFRNLERGQTLGLPSGQAVAKLLGVLPLTDEIIWSAGSRLLDSAKLDAEAKADVQTTTDARAKVFEDWGMDNGCVLAGNCPLWFYILREAEYYGVKHRPDDPMIGFGGQHLGPVGSRIICETLLGLLWMDKSSFLHSNRGFTPLPQIAGGQMTLARLIEYALS
ncbi:peroxidase family protein [Lichenibacterium ramalinae]|uniref:Peroxidase n=1 Tax=Lichenibacterium ramalinae TaxID=2316527 RepID=A0A4V1RJA3_9HYPH|nr:heme peroxidase family protein [Lichenibacterium ramalinae]RYB07860.1 peroxidase [Lichenibacterium ramalinae]